MREQGSVVDKDWNEMITYAIDSNLDHQIDFVRDKLALHGCAVYYSHLYQQSNGLTLTYVLLIGAETFGMMREGVFLPIKKRGRMLLQ